MEVFIVVALPPLFVSSENTSEKKQGKGKENFTIGNEDIKSLIEKYLKLRFKTFRSPVHGRFVPHRAYKFIRNFYLLQ